MKLSCLTICCMLAVCTTAFGQSNYAVLMQESPIGAGEIKPGIGVHTFNANESVTLTTVPKAGWRFVYWLGDVSDPTANRTRLSVDGPKIVIAVFERNEYELPGGSAPVSSGPQHLTPRQDRISSGGFSGNASRKPSYPSPDPYPTPDPIPEPVPEPYTIFLLSTGACIGFRKIRPNATPIKKNE